MARKSDTASHNQTGRIGRRACTRIIVICTLALAGCLTLAGVPAAHADPAAGQKATAASTGKQQGIENGKKFFSVSCSACHGEEGKGAGALDLRTRSLTQAQAAAAIANGKSGTIMPKFTAIYDKAQIADIAAYVVSLSSGSAPAAAAAGSANTGAAIYSAQCASCHEAGGPPYLNRIALKPTAPEYVVHMLAAGAMHVQGRQLTLSQRKAVAEYISGRPLGGSQGAAVSAERCSGQAPTTLTGPEWRGWGADVENSRFQPAAAAGLSAEQATKLKLKWAFAFPGEAAAYTQPTVAGGRVFAGGPLGDVYSLDVSTGCTYWHFQADAGVRSAFTIGPGHLAYFGDFRANVYAVNALTGKLVWKTRVSNHPYARVSGTPMLDKGRLYVPVASREEWMASHPSYECCTFRGILVALDAATGKEVWRTYTIPGAPKPTHKGADGSQKWGPSGAGLWSSPTLDTKRQLLYIGAGNNYSDPPTANSDAILAIDLKTGKIAWSRQITEGDAYTISCFRDKANCPEKFGPDSDFGASPILHTLPGGRQVLVVSQKSGIVFGLDPDDQGKILWQIRVGKGGALGGIEWGPAVEGDTVYAALSDLEFGVGPEGTVLNPKAGGGLFAIDIATGKQIWAALPPPEGCTTPRCSPAQMAAVTAIPGVIFSGAYDGHLRAYSATDGKIIWDYNTAQKFDTVNKLPGNGGAIDGGGPAVVGGMLFVNSGYGAVTGMTGNVLLAFSPE
jgi:polyvinyl alcohol dehydrogenase (cytochrome)